MIGYPDRGERAKIDVRRASRARRTRHVHTPRLHHAFVENFSDAPRDQDNLLKLLSALSTITKGSGARGGDGGERGQEKYKKICVTMLVDIKLYGYCNK